ncbi:MAG: metallophosphoesterase, partial [Candidatus Thermoplasmatota archaeon]|nr:metallophosphoesterase [Candidatus Thermoplasmatota archaeon]
MKILAAGDIHGKEERIDSLLYAMKEHKPDIFVLAGDLTTFGPAKLAVKLLKKIPIKTLCVP